MCCVKPSVCRPGQAWVWRQRQPPGASRVELALATRSCQVRDQQSSADTGAPADSWHAVTRAGEARERPSLGTSMEDMMSHHKPFPYLLGAMIGT